MRISAEAPGGLGGVQVPYAWHAVGATAYQIFRTGAVTGQSSSRIFLDTTGILTAVDLVGNPIKPQTTVLLVLALDPAAGAFRQNVTGALGTFGSASVLDPPKVIVWQ